MDFCKEIFSEVFLYERIRTSVLSIPGVLTQNWKPQIILGKAWLKQTRDGREYFKARLDFCTGANGKKLYARLWPRKSDPGVLGMYPDAKDLPINIHPLMLLPTEVVHTVQCS